jgi:hypothetical protein
LWCFYKPEELWLGAAVSFSLFCISLGIMSYCLLQNKDEEINSAMTDAATSFCKNMEGVLVKEQHLRKMDHAVRMLVLIDSLKMVKRIFNLNNSDQATNASVIARTKRMINNTIDNLRNSM